MAGSKKVGLAYSGGLDTSCILKWLLEQGYEVVCFLTSVGQVSSSRVHKFRPIVIDRQDEDDWDKIRQKVLKLGQQKW